MRARLTERPFPTRSGDRVPTPRPCDDSEPKHLAAVRQDESGREYLDDPDLEGGRRYRDETYEQARERLARRPKREAEFRRLLASFGIAFVSDGKRPRARSTLGGSRPMARPARRRSSAGSRDGPDSELAD